MVVEAAVKSSSLIMARAGLEHNRVVFAIPGSIHYAQSKGYHLLIKQGATVVEQAADLVTELAGALVGVRENLLAENIASTPAFGFDEDQRVLLDIIGFDLVDLDTLSRVSRWPVEKLSQTLVRLELCHAINNNNWYYQRLV